MFKKLTLPTEHSQFSVADGQVHLVTPKEEQPAFYLAKGSWYKGKKGSGDRT